MRTARFTSSFRPLRAMRLAAVVLGIGLVAMTGHARAADDEDDETFEEKVIKNIMQGLGGTNMDNTGIVYRERSPLVVPPKIDLPPPNANAELNVPNWPKDPDVQRRKAAIAAAKKKQSPEEQARPLMPSELAANRTAPEKRSIDSDKPGDPNANPVLSPSQLGFTGFKNMFGGNVAETAPFKGEPPRDSLTMPPTGYQTPSPAYAYGTGPKESLNKEYNPAAGKY